MAKVSDLDIKRLTNELDAGMLLEQTVSFENGLVALVLFERAGRAEALRLLKHGWANSPDDSFEKALGWTFHLRTLAWNMRLAKAARSIPGVYDLLGKSIITHWFQSLSLREIDLVDDPIRAFGAPVSYLEKRGIKSFRQHLRDWRRSRANGVA